ncbi:MAG TPA: LuxR C-terminal-related transcriptional regulator [Tenuifilaceae bacterium]|nr:LuxR C-terminal-related transcriptional regulator [Tenuifilaceae bacterium]
MDKERKNIVIIEPSPIVFEGISASIAKRENGYSFFWLENIDEISILQQQKRISIILINPAIIQNRLQEFVKVKNQFPEIYWIGILYSFFDSHILTTLNDTFSITDSISIVIKKINKICKDSTSKLNYNEDLSKREIDVLKLLAKGFSNKEIADKLNISIHTVMSHRKNIMDKTGIRSLPGLTIFAVTKKIITLE